MAAIGAWTSPADQPGGARLNGRVKVRTRYDLEDFVSLVWRQRYFMFAVFMVVLLIGVCGAMFLK